MAQVQLKRQRRNQQKGQRRQQREPICGLDCLDLKTRSSDAKINAPATSPVMNG